MKNSKNKLGLLWNFAMMLLISTVSGLSFVYVAPALFGLSLAPQLPGVLGMAIQKEIWIADIVESLWRDNQFLEYAMNADEYVLAGKVVHIPNAGAAPSVTKNRSSLPATVAKRTDVDITFNLDEYTTDPVLIPNAETVEVSYDKRASVLAETKNSISQTVAENILLSWMPTLAANIIRTTGAAITAHMPSATSTRLKFLPDDLKKAGKQMDKDAVSPLNRVAIFSAEMYDQFTDSLTATQYRDFSASFDAATGVCGTLYGFKIFKRSFTAVYDNATTPQPKAYGAAAAATDNDVVLCWQKDCVIRALGTVDFFENMGDPTYYGDIYSSLLRAGGRIKRNDAKGIVAIVQAAS